MPVERRFQGGRRATASATQSDAFVVVSSDSIVNSQAVVLACTINLIVQLASTAVG